MNKLNEKLDKYQERFCVPFSDWPRKQHGEIISIDNNSNEIVGFIKTFEFDFKKHQATYTTTDDPGEALKFSGEVSTMLYHYLSHISDIKKHSHYPVSLKPNKRKLK